MTIMEAMKYVSKRALLTVEKLQVPVLIDDVRTVYGNDQVHVSPIDGAGSQWVDVSRVRVTE